MPEFCIMHGKEEVGVLDVSEKGFSVMTDHDLAKLVEKFRSHFKEVGTSTNAAVTTYRFENKLPVDSYFEILIRVRSIVVKEHFCLGSDSIKCIG